VVEDKAVPGAAGKYKPTIVAMCEPRTAAVEELPRMSAAKPFALLGNVQGDGPVQACVNCPVEEVVPPIGPGELDVNGGLVGPTSCALVGAHRHNKANIAIKYFFITAPVK